MQLTLQEQAMLNGTYGHALKKSMEILTALGEIYGAAKLIAISSAQIAGVSYDSLGDAGLEFLADMARDGKTKVLTTLNPAGMDRENWQKLGISGDFAAKQQQVLEAFKTMDVVNTCTCTPYFIGNSPRFAQHVAWSESSAVAYANSVLGVKTNREGGPSALAAALTGRTAYYGMHLEQNRQAQVIVEVDAQLNDVVDFGALAKVIANKIHNQIPLIRNIDNASVEDLKSFAASIATYGGTAMFHMEGITPNVTAIPQQTVVVTQKEIREICTELSDSSQVDLVSIGCPHCSLAEIRQIALLLKDKTVNKEFWICVSRPIKTAADQMGYSEIIENAGAKFACDTCMVVAPIKGRFKTMATNSAKSVYYARAKNKFQTVYRPLEECVQLAIDPS